MKKTKTLKVPASTGCTLFSPSTSHCTPLPCFGTAPQTYLLAPTSGTKLTLPSVISLSKYRGPLKSPTQFHLLPEMSLATWNPAETPAPPCSWSWYYWWPSVSVFYSLTSATLESVSFNGRYEGEGQGHYTALHYTAIIGWHLFHSATQRLLWFQQPGRLGRLLQAEKTSQSLEGSVEVWPLGK